MTAKDQDKIDEFAMRAMEGMLHGLYSNPGMLAQFAEIANQNKRTSAAELADRSYGIAAEMYRKRKAVVGTITEND